ncbi:MAG: hypothetical protein U0840_25690 [Gemmataceae bacterium]
MAIAGRDRSQWEHTSALMWAAMQGFAKRKISPAELNPYHNREIPEVADTAAALRVFLPNPNQRR